tara:strand:+ start:4632 stop:5825 length:1194 start_codon:yes stop_codon:yes gene_type:complete
MQNNYWTNLFGLSSGKNDNLTKMLTRQKNQFWGNTKPTWVDTDKPYDLYIQIPELRTVINKRAIMMSSGIPKLCDLDGNPVEKHWMLDLINKPNPTQSWSDVMYSLSVNDGLFNNSFAYCPKRSFNVRNLLLPLPSNKIKIVGTGKYLDQIETDGLIKEFQFWYDNKKKENLSVEDVIYLNTPDGINLLNPINRIDTLKYPLSNIMSQYNKRNVILENMGAIGILSSKKSDMGGSLPMTAEERDEIQQDWVSRNKDKLVMTEADVNWTPMSYPTKDLMLFEELTEDKMAIIDAYGLSYYLFSQAKGSTFTNVKEGMKMSYQDTIIPETNQMYSTISHQLGLIDEGLYLKADFSHIPVLQDDINAEASAMNLRADAVNKILLSGIELSDEEKRSLLGL